jgi:CBS domain-containing protein
MSVLIQDIMIANPLVITPKMKLWEVAELFLAKKISGAPIADESGHVISIMGQGALLRVLVQEGMDATVAHCMPHLTATKDLITLKREDSLKDAYQLFIKHDIHRIPITDASRKLLGMVSRGAVLRMIVEAHYGKKVNVA